jgi:hypothetical protein
MTNAQKVRGIVAVSEVIAKPAIPMAPTTAKVRQKFFNVVFIVIPDAFN